MLSSMKMSEKSLKISLDVSELYALDAICVLHEAKEKVFSWLKEQNLETIESVVNNACKNTLSLARTKKKNQQKTLAVYIPRFAIVAGSPSSSCSLSSFDLEESDSDRSECCLSTNSGQEEDSQLLFKYNNDNKLMIRTNFTYMKSIFSDHLQNHVKSNSVLRFMNEIFSYCFFSSHQFYVDVAKMRRHICSQSSCYVRDAKKRAKMKHVTVTKVLMEIRSFCFHIDVLQLVPADEELLSLDFAAYVRVSSYDRFLVIRNDEMVSIQPGNMCVCASQTLCFEAIKKFEISKTIDVNEIVILIKSYCQQRSLTIDIVQIEETLKSAILERRHHADGSKFMISSLPLCIQDSSLSDVTDVNLDDLLDLSIPLEELKEKVMLCH